MTVSSDENDETQEVKPVSKAAIEAGVTVVRNLVDQIEEQLNRIDAVLRRG